jgi:hypothetical protein
MMNKRIARALNTAALLSAGAVICSAGFAQTAGDDAAAAKSMLQKAVAAVKADKAKAIETIQQGRGRLLHQGPRPVSVLLHQGGRQDRRYPDQAGAWQGCQDIQGQVRQGVRAGNL